MNLLAFFMGPFEMIFVCLVGVLLFGRRLPEVANSVGAAIKGFKKGVKDIEDTVSK